MSLVDKIHLNLADCKINLTLATFEWHLTSTAPSNVLSNVVLVKQWISGQLGFDFTLLSFQHFPHSPHAAFSPTFQRHANQVDWTCSSLKSTTRKKEYMDYGFGCQLSKSLHISIAGGIWKSARLKWWKRFCEAECLSSISRRLCTAILKEFPMSALQCVAGLANA